MRTLRAITRTNTSTTGIHGLTFGGAEGHDDQDDEDRSQQQDDEQVKDMGGADWPEARRPRVRPARLGMIALMGLDAETGVFMLLFLDLSYDEAKAKGLVRSRKDLEEAIIHGAVKRVRPKMMTVTAAFMGLMPIMWSTGAGADVMKRIAAPMVGGLVTSFLLELLVYPAIYLLWRQRELRAHGRPLQPHATSTLSGVTQ
jgi:hypothetical protein